MVSISVFLLLLLLLLGVRDAQGEAASSCTNTSSLSLFIGLKTTTATSVYVGRAREIMSSWGQNAVGHIALITDRKLKSHNEDLKRQYRSLPIIEMKGTERFGDYRRGPHYRYIGYQSQRVKVRSAIKWFASNVRQDSGLKWFCYIDDDMYVNVDRLDESLSAVWDNPPPTCSQRDRCIVADVGPINITSVNRSKTSVLYSNAVWCMALPTLMAVDKLFRTKSDSALGWVQDEGTDDVGLALLLKRHLNITYTDSLEMVSINNRIAISPYRHDNPIGSYSMHKVNLRGDKNEWNMLGQKKAPADVLSRIAVLNLPHVNYTELYERKGAHVLARPVPLKREPIVDMKQWNAFVEPKPTCKKLLSQTLNVSSVASFIIDYNFLTAA